MAMAERVPVLVVGAGVTGLSASLFLAQQGVRALVVEQRAGTNPYPRARGVNGRTMELMRELGLADEIRAAGERLAPAVGLYTGATLVEVLRRRGQGSWMMRRMRARGMRGQENKRSPTGPCRCTQDIFEPILLRAARERGVDARFSTELISFAQDLAGVTATLRDRATGTEHSVRADYLIGADGARSPVRASVGIARSGSRTYGHQVNVLFRADLAALVRGREFSLCLVENTAVRGLIASIDNADTWVIHISYDPERGERPEDFTPARCEALVREAVGISDLQVAILGVSPWQSAVRIAERYRQGRVFLAGDAAHSIPPWGGLGANTAIQDAHNLAWKLGLVLADTARESLLDTYETERLPVGRAAGEISGRMNGVRGLIAVPRRLGALRTVWAMRHVFPYLTMGYGYASSAVALEPGKPPGPGTSSLDGRPGTRTPHAWLMRGEKRLSTLDLIGGRFVLLAGDNANEWCDAAQEEAKRLGVRLDCERLAEHQALGIGRDGAVLVRPDGIVAWRSRERGPKEILVRALTQILGQPYGHRSDGANTPASTSA
jgi:putative polyketide hydroxylase